MSERLQLDGVDLVFDDGSARSVDLILVPCMTCFAWADASCRQSSFWQVEWTSDRASHVTAQNVTQHDHCPECEGSGWLLVDGEPISLEDLERMAPWAEDFKTVQSYDLSIESGEVDGLP